MGLVNRALPADEVLPAAQDYVRELARDVVAGVDGGDEAPGLHASSTPGWAPPSGEPSS